VSVTREWILCDVMVQKKSPTWSDVKAKLAEFDRISLLGLVKDLYGVSKDNQAFLHARFGLGAEVLKPYKTRIDRWLSPDLLKNQSVSASKAKKAITDYKNAIGRPEGLAELMVFYCERASDFSNALGFADEAYFSALVKMFEQALKISITLENQQRHDLLDRLDDVRSISHNLGYGVGDEMNILLAEYKDDI
jgi:nitrate reductase NapAB chaperone NapD